MKKEEQFYLDALNKWKDFPNLHLLGHPNTHARDHDRLAVFSFMVFHPKSKLYLHHNFVAALLNDLFGIQVGPVFLLNIIQQLLVFDRLFYRDLKDWK